MFTDFYRHLGIGDYVALPPVSMATLSPGSNFTVSSNAVVVNVASPEAIAEAVVFLIENPSVRELVGRAGRQTVLDYFTVDRQMEQYSVLYAELAGLRL
jgi:glycosyltransferase involved in cell wall biosynthesis